MLYRYKKLLNRVVSAVFAAAVLGAGVLKVLVPEKWRRKWLHSVPEAVFCVALLMLCLAAIAGDTVRDFVMGKRVERHFQKREDGVIYLPESPRTHFLNFVGRNFCRRLATNWMGDDGMIRKMGWRMVNDYPKEQQFDHFPEGHFRESWLLKVPYLKEAGRFTNTHGTGPDCALVHGYVTDKWVEDNGDHLVMLTCTTHGWG